MDDRLGDAQMLQCALQQAMAELGALGGMAHIRVRDITRGLRLVASSSLPPAYARLWENISEDGPAAPARATQRNMAAFSPAAAVPEQAFGRRTPAVPRATGVPPDAGVVAVPIPGPEGTLGTLSVLVSGHHGPVPAQQTFLLEVARWAGSRLRLAPPGPEGVLPALLQESGPGRDRVPESAAGGNWEWDLRSGDMKVDAGLLDAMGIDRGDFADTIESLATHIHPDDLSWVVAETDRTIRARGLFDIEYRVRGTDGGYSWIRSRGHTVSGEGGEPAGMTGVAWNVTEAHASLESVGRALLHMSDGFLSATSDGRIRFVNAAAERVLGPARCLMGRFLWEVPAVCGVPRLAGWCREAAAAGVPAEHDAPLPTDGRWSHLRLIPSPDGLALYITDVTEKHRREEADRAAAERASFVSAITRTLTETVTAQDVVNAVAETALPFFDATGMLITAVEDGHLGVVGSVGLPPDFLNRFPPGPLERLHGPPPTTPSAATPVGEAIQTRAPVFTTTQKDFATRYPKLADFAAGMPQETLAFLPLIVSGHPIGGLTISWTGSRSFDEDDHTLLNAVSGLVAQALGRARLYDSATTRARELQRGLLPRELPSLPAVTAAARYLPAGQGAEIGGDWYDVIPLSADRVALVVGDVMGHGLPEAAAMGRLRTAVRTLAHLELPPEDLLARLNDIVGDLGNDRFATCLYGIYDPVTGEFCYANAGHPPPAAVLPDGTVSFFPAAPNPPLGSAVPPFITASCRLADGGVLVLYTDGLVGGVDRDLDLGMGRLAHALSTTGSGEREDLDALSDLVTAVLLPEGSSADDAVLLMTRVHRLRPDDIAVWALPDDPVAAGQARRLIRERLAGWGLDELTMTTELLASELIGNVIRHAKGPIRLRLLRSRTLICEVSDSSLTTPHVRRAGATDEGGRGLQLVAALSQRWGTRYTESGKCIWTEQLIPDEANRGR
ncbi:SpoIIE family protein phosphatase [Streptomyces caeni]|uniref:SpoIIE family protein phosphatase n=1 Tax=Streptomyces caeni TaxID=2307231 RepID=A0ABW4IYM3_9ACTN